jgi:hypothetical protein
MADARFGKSVILRGCVFEQSIDLQGARVGGTLDLTHSTVAGRGATHKSANFDQIRIDGSLLAAGLVSEVKLDFGYAQVQGRFSCRSDEYRRTEVGADVSLYHAKLSGPANFNGARIAGDVDLRDADVKGDLRFESVAGHRCEIEGDVLLADAVLGGTFSCRGAKIAKAVRATGATVEGDVTVVPQDGLRPDIGGPVEMHSLHLSGHATFSGCRVGKGLILTSSRIDRGVYIGPDGGFFPEVADGALDLQKSQVAGDVSFVAAKVGGNLDLRMARVGGTLFCLPVPTGRPQVEGDLDLSGIHCRQQVFLRGAKVGGDLNVTLARIEQGLFLCPPEGAAGDRVEVAKGVDLQGSSVFLLDFDGRICADRDLKLCGTEATIVQIHEALPTSVDLEGFKFKEITVVANSYRQLLAATKPFHRGSYLLMEKWLRDKGDEETADGVYLDMRRRSRRESPATAPPPAGKRPASRLRNFFEWLFLDFAIRYGTASHRLGFVIVALIAVSTWFFSFGDAVEADRPSQARPVNSTAAAEPAVPPAAPSDLDPLWLSLNYNFPVVRLPAADKFKPSAATLADLGLVRITYRDYASGISFLSWVTVPLFLASASGLIKRQK